VQDSKKNATEALGQVPQIKRLIEEASDKTARAQKALAGAESSAINARDTAQRAQKTYAEQAVEVCEIVSFGTTRGRGWYFSPPSHRLPVVLPRFVRSIRPF